MTGPHVCQWQRLPVVDFSAVYRCKGCARAMQVGVGAMLGRTLDDLDAAFQQEFGGVVIEPFLPEVTPEEIRRRAAELAGFNFDFPAYTPFTIEP